jgi:ubiquinone/menaquinone biosynthesis C-methylase UbiE
MAPTHQRIANLYKFYATGYDGIAEHNQWVAPTLTANTVHRLATRLGRPVETVLDVGGGTGLSSEAIKNLYPDSHVTDFDLAPETLEVARSYNRADAYIQGNAEHLPFEDNTFDVTVMVGLLHYNDKEGAQQILREAHRVTKTGGLIAGTCIVIEHGGIQPAYIAHVTHSTRDIFEPMRPGLIVYSRPEITRVKGQQDVKELVFGVLVR